MCQNDTKVRLVDQREREEGKEDGRSRRSQMRSGG
jgi:hypothetical protein